MQMYVGGFEVTRHGGVLMPQDVYNFIIILLFINLSLILGKKMCLVVLRH